LTPRISNKRAVFAVLVAAVAVSGVLAAGTGRAESLPGATRTPDLLVHELVVFGPAASATWQGFAAADDEFGTGGRVERERSFSGLGRRVKAGLLSLLLPGAGQYYNGDHQKALIFAGVEAAVWASYLTFHIQGENRSETYEEYAGIYAGVQGEHGDAYWQSVGRYLDSDAYNEAIRREARAFGEAPSGLVGPAEGWQWRTDANLQTYKELRARANSSYDRRDFMTLFAIVNRAVAVFDAVRNSVDETMSGDVLGFHIEVEVEPSFHNSKAEWTISRSF
jgi:hypothetical protein